MATYQQSHHNALKVGDCVKIAPKGRDLVMDGTGDEWKKLPGGTITDVTGPTALVNFVVIEPDEDTRLGIGRPTFRADQFIWWVAESEPAPTPTPEPTFVAPHSRACGVTPHAHGRECAENCPTCAGGRVMREVVIADIPGEAQKTRSTAKDGSEWSQEWRQVAWYGLSTGIVYGLHDEKGVREDRAGIGGLWMLAHNDRVEKPDAEEDETAPGPCGNATEGLTVGACQRRPEGCACFPVPESSAYVRGIEHAAEHINAYDGAPGTHRDTVLRLAESLVRLSHFARERMASESEVEMFRRDHNATTDDDLPGAWSHSDFTGGDSDTRSYAQRAADAAAEGDYDRADAYLAKVQTPDRAEPVPGPTEWVAVCKFCWERQDAEDPMRGAVSVPVSAYRVAAGVAETHSDADHTTYVWTTRRLRTYNRENGDK